MGAFIRGLITLGVKFLHRIITKKRCQVVIQWNYKQQNYGRRKKNLRNASKPPAKCLSSLNAK